MIVWLPAGTRDKHRPSKSDAPGESMCSPGGIVGTRVKSREKLGSEVTWVAGIEDVVFFVLTWASEQTALINNCGL